MVKTQCTKSLYRNRNKNPDKIIVSAEKISGNGKPKNLLIGNANIISDFSYQRSSKPGQTSLRNKYVNIKAKVKRPVQNSRNYIDQEDIDMDKTIEFLDWYIQDRKNK